MSSTPRCSGMSWGIKGDISKRDGTVKHSQGVFLRQVYVIRKNGLRISLITHDRRPIRAALLEGQVLQSNIPAYRAKISVSTCDDCVLKIDLFNGIKQ